MIAQPASTGFEGNINPSPQAHTSGNRNFSISYETTPFQRPDLGGLLVCPWINPYLRDVLLLIPPYLVHFWGVIERDAMGDDDS